MSDRSPLSSVRCNIGTKRRNYRQLEAVESKRLPTKFAKAVAVRCIVPRGTISTQLLQNQELESPDVHQSPAQHPRSRPLAHPAAHAVPRLLRHVQRRHQEHLDRRRSRFLDRPGRPALAPHARRDSPDPAPGRLLRHRRLDRLQQSRAESLQAHQLARSAPLSLAPAL